METGKSDVMRIAQLMVLLAAVFAGLQPTICHAELACAWLNAATASGALGGEVIMHVTAGSTQGDTTCEFVRKDNSSAVLKIVVYTMKTPAVDFPTALAQCSGTTVPLQAIGNEAFQCVTKTPPVTNERVIGRVRERTFILTISPGNQSPSAAITLRESTRNLAEQIAGSLF